MASISKPPPLPNNLHRHSLFPHHCSPVTLSFSFRATTSFPARVGALKTGSDGGGGRIGSQELFGPDFLRKPVVSPRKDLAGIPEEEKEIERKRNYGDGEDDDKWVDWEDKILEDTVPLVGFVRMILHSEK